MTENRPMECPRCHQTHERCAGHNSRGFPCQKWPKDDMTVCGTHGGSAPQVIAARDRRVAEREAAQILRVALDEAYGGQVPHIDPADAMLQAVSWKYAECLALRQQLANVDDIDLIWGVTKTKDGGDDAGTTKEAKPNVWWSMLRTAEEQLVKFSAAARAAKCDERRIQIARDAGAQLAGAIRQILDALSLSDEQQELVPVVVPAALRALSAGPEQAAS